MGTQAVSGCARHYTRYLRQRGRRWGGEVVVGTRPPGVMWLFKMRSTLEEPFLNFLEVGPKGIRLTVYKQDTFWKLGGCLGPLRPVDRKPVFVEVERVRTQSVLRF